VLWRRIVWISRDNPGVEPPPGSLRQGLIRAEWVRNRRYDRKCPPPSPSGVPGWGSDPGIGGVAGGEPGDTGGASGVTTGVDVSGITPLIGGCEIPETPGRSADMPPSSVVPRVFAAMFSAGIMMDGFSKSWDNRENPGVKLLSPCLGFQAEIPNPPIALDRELRVPLV